MSEYKIALFPFFSFFLSSFHHAEMMDVTHFQEDQHHHTQLPSNADTSSALHGQYIRFSFPDRPFFEQDNSYGYSPRTFDNDCNMKKQHCQWAEFPFFMASFLTVVSTFVSVRAIGKVNKRSKQTLP
jgi:hypothetical protein